MFLYIKKNLSTIDCTKVQTNEQTCVLTVTRTDGHNSIASLFTFPSIFILFFSFSFFLLIIADEKLKIENEKNCRT